MTTPSHAMRRSLERSARAFDVPALLDVLALLGYRESDVVFSGPIGWTSRGSVVEAVELAQGARARAEVTTNLGLLGPQGPLPSFLLEALEAFETRQDTRLLDLLGALDHHALALRFASLYPERDPRLAGGADWETAKRSVTRSLGLASPSSLHWLFSQVFPELAVAVRRDRASRRVPAQDYRIGALQLGVAALGGEAEIEAGGIEVVLTADAPPPAPSWAFEARRRIREQVAPTLTGLELELTVWLLLREAPHPLRLALDAVGDAVLGEASLAEPPASPGDDDASFEANPPGRSLLICTGPISALHSLQP